MYTKYLAYFNLPLLEGQQYIRFSEAFRTCLAEAADGADMTSLTLLDKTAAKLEYPDYDYLHELVKQNPRATPEESLMTIYLPLILSKLYPSTHELLLEKGWSVYICELLSELSPAHLGRGTSSRSQRVLSWSNLKGDIWAWMLQNWGSFLDKDTLRNVFRKTRTLLLLLKLRMFICLGSRFLDDLKDLPASLYESWLVKDQDLSEIRLATLNILIGLNATLFRSEGKVVNRELSNRLYEDFLRLEKSSRDSRLTDHDDAQKLLHIGIIMDGNRRWGRLHGLPGHYFGTHRTEELLRWFMALPNLQELTLYCLSADNLKKRDSQEIESLQHLMCIYLTNLIRQADVLANKLTIKIIGEVGALPKELGDLIRGLEQLYSQSSDDPLIPKKSLNLAIAYDPVLEVKRHLKTRSSSQDACSGLEPGLEPGLGPGPGPGHSNDCNNFLSNQIDWVIRCGDVQRTSGFFPLNTLYSEWAFLPELWPDMTYNLFLETLEELGSRQRRFGA